MTHDWLLVETLGDEPAVVARGRELKKLVPITTFLRRSPYLAAVRTAIAETLQTGQSLTSITPKHDRVIRTEPVIMTDGRMHGVQVWSGPTDAEPPDRPIPGPLKWDLTRGVATDTPESLTNSGKNPEVEITYGRAFAEDLPARVRAKGSEDFWETHAHASRIAISCAPADCPPVTGRPFDRHRAVVGGVRCHM